MHYQFVNYLEQNNSLSERQYRYRKKKVLQNSLYTAYLIDGILKAADKGLITGALFVDLSKAFNTLGQSRHQGTMLRYKRSSFFKKIFAHHQVIKLNNETKNYSRMWSNSSFKFGTNPIFDVFNDFHR